MTELLLHERQTLIRKRLSYEGRVIAADLAQEFSISEDTIRRDLREMAAAGLCKRVYGGALQASPLNDNSLLSRLSDRPDRKQALAKAAVQLFCPGMSLFIDAGTTNLAIAQAIPDDMPMTVITNAPIIGAALLGHVNINVVMIGGQLDRTSGAVLGGKALQDASHFHADLCVLGSCGLDIESGVTATFYEEAEFKRFIANQSRQVLAAVTNDKLEAPTPFAVIPISRCHHTVIEYDADLTQAARIAACGTTIIRAGKT